MCAPILFYSSLLLTHIEHTHTHIHTPAGDDTTYVRYCVLIMTVEKIYCKRENILYIVHGMFVDETAKQTWVIIIIIIIMNCQYRFYEFSRLCQTPFTVDMRVRCLCCRLFHPNNVECVHMFMIVKHRNGQNDYAEHRKSHS